MPPGPIRRRRRSRRPRAAKPARAGSTRRTAAAQRPRRSGSPRRAPGAALVAEARRFSLRAVPAPARVAVAALLVLALGGGGFLLLRDASLFRVDHVRVTGATGAAAPRIAAALRDTAGSMTTLHLDEAALRRSVASFAQVRGLEVHTDGRNGLKVRVLEYMPVGAVSDAGRHVPVAGDGTLLRGVPAGRDLPLVPVTGGAAGDRLANPAGLRAVAVLAAAPRALRPLVERVTTGARGLGATLRRGPAIYFGTGDRLVAKWAAAAGVLADEDARGADYIDVRLPERPAAGGLPDAGLSASALDSTLATDPSAAGGQVGGTATDGTSTDGTSTDGTSSGDSSTPQTTQTDPAG